MVTSVTNICKVSNILVNYWVELEDSFENASTKTINISNQSRADHVCYILVPNDDHITQHPVVVLETKFSQSLDEKAIAQVLAYYCKSQSKHTLTARQGCVNSVVTLVEIND